MKLTEIIAWLEGVLEPRRFDDVANNGLQIARRGETVGKVAFAVDGSAKSAKAAIAAGAELLVVHHGISWGGGIRRLVGGEYEVVKAAMTGDLALYASHLPLDANRECGNNWEMARAMGLEDVRPEFSYHGNVIGLVGRGRAAKIGAFVDGELRPGAGRVPGADADREILVGVCSGGAAAFAAEAKALGCEALITGEADWGEKIAAENVGMPLILGGHYETETFGVKALMRKMSAALRVGTVFVSSLLLAVAVNAADVEEDFAADYVEADGVLLLPQGGRRMSRLGGASLRYGHYFRDWCALEGEAGWLEDRAALAVRALLHWRGWSVYDRFFGFSRWDPFFTVGASGWLPDGDVGPSVGVGALYYLTDDWALRAAAEATLGLDCGPGMEYALSAGARYSF